MPCRPRCAATAALLASCVIFLACFGGAPAAAQDQRLRFEGGAKPANQIEPNDAYGRVRFSLEMFVNGKASNRSVFDALLTGLGGLMKEEGTYLLTVEILSPADEVLARRAILSTERKSSGWLIFNRVVKESETTEWFGDLLTNRLLRPDTNDIRVRVRSYFSKSAQLDLSTFNLLADVVAKAKLLGAANTVLDTTWKPLAATIETMIGSYKQSDVSGIATLSFTRFNGEPNPGSGVFVREYKVEGEEGQRPEKVRVQVRVETDTVKARVATLYDGKVSPQTSYGDVLAAARIADQPIDLLLATSTNETVKGFMSDLNSSAGFAGADIGERCDKLQEELSRSFSLTDKVVSYWALLHRYRRKLATNLGAKECLPAGVKGQMTELGLSLEDLPFAGGTVVAEGPSAPGDTDVRKGPGGSGAKDDGTVLARRSILEELLGQKNVTETYQFFPDRKIVE